MRPMALLVAREHCDYAALQGLSPIETLRTVGIRTSKYHVPSWEFVEHQLGIRWLDMNEQRREAA